MSENTFNSLEINLQTQPLPTYIDADGSFKLNTPMLSSFDFDGLIPKFDGNINAIDIKPGYMIQAVPGEYFPVVSVEYDEDGMEDTPSGIVTINYINDQGNTVSVDYDEADPVPVVYENWDEKSLGTQGWGITAGGNAIFTNVAVRGDFEAQTLDVGGSTGITYDGTNVTIGASVIINAPVTFNGSGSFVTFNDLSASYALQSFVDTINNRLSASIDGLNLDVNSLSSSISFLYNAGFVTDSDLITASATTINGNNITTGLINANLVNINSGPLTASAGFKINSLGLFAYNSSGTQTFKIDSNTGVVTIGAVTADQLATDSDLDGKIDNGDAAADIITYQTTITGGNISTGNIKSGGYSGPGTASAFSASGMLINLDDGSIAAPNFRIDRNGFSFFKGLVTSTGLIIEGVSASIGYTRYSSGTQASVTDTYSILSSDGKDIFLKAAAGDPAKIRWLDSSSRQRATLGWEVSDDEGGEGTAYPNTLVIRANAVDASPTDTPGQILIHAQGAGSNINLKTGTNGAVTINGEPIETPGTITNRYKNGTDTPGSGNTIKYGTSATLPTGAAQGDIYLRYV